MGKMGVETLFCPAKANLKPKPYFALHPRRHPGSQAKTRNWLLPHLAKPPWF